MYIVYWKVRSKVLGFGFRKSGVLLLLLSLLLLLLLSLLLLLLLVLLLLHSPTRADLGCWRRWTWAGV